MGDSKNNPLHVNDNAMDILSELNSIEADSASNAPAPDAAALRVSDFIRITVTKDQLKASMTALRPPARLDFSAEAIYAALAAAGVKEGFCKQRIESFSRNPVFNQPVTVAEGQPATSGEPGYYEFMFPTSSEMKPKILADGSVDYSGFHNICTVDKDAEVARYHPAVQGEPGRSVTGNTIPAKRGPDLPRLKGKGFYTSEDGMVYYAATEGRPAFKDGSLTVTNLLEIDSDVNHSTGNVTFSGDVYVKGSVGTGMTIQTSGSIVVDGHVEGAQLTAGRDILLKGGMQGSDRGVINAGGSVQGKFFEHVSINCKGDLMANSILNCSIRCYGALQVDGRLGIIVGGNVYALRGIKATIIGNMAEIKTSVSVGMDEDLTRERVNCEKQVAALQDEIDKIDSGLGQITGMLARVSQPDLKEKKALLFRAKVSRGSALHKLEEKMARYDQIAKESRNSRIAVVKSIYPRVTVSINGISKILTAEGYNVTYKLSEGEISTVSTG